MDQKKESKPIFRSKLAIALYAAGALIGIGFFWAVFPQPLFLVLFIVYLIVLAGLALPVGITCMLNAREALNSRVRDRMRRGSIRVTDGNSVVAAEDYEFLSVRGIVITGIGCILFFGIMLPGVGTIAVPGLLNIVQPMFCPAGFDTISGDIAVRQYDMPFMTFKISRNPICTGELGTYRPGNLGRFHLLLSGMIMYLIYCGIYFSLALVIGKQKFFVLQRYAAQGVILAIFIPLLFVTLLNASFLAVVSKPINGLFYRGHAESLVGAVKRHNIGMIKDLLARGGDINAKNAYNETPLSVAQQYKDKEVLDLFAGQITGGSDGKKALLDKGIVYGEANFFKSVEKNDIESVKLFLSAGMDINALLDNIQHNKWETALAVAAGKGHKDLMQLLLDRKADTNKMGESGHTPLQTAVLNSRDDRNNIACHDDIVLLLIKNGADVNAKTRRGEAALMMAARIGCPGVAQVLIDNKADIHARTEFGYTALLYAVDRGVYGNRDNVLIQDRYNLVKYLLEHGADPNVSIYDTGDTPLRIAKKEEKKMASYGVNGSKAVQLLEQYHARD